MNTVKDSIKTLKHKSPYPPLFSLSLSLIKGGDNAILSNM